VPHQPRNLSATEPAVAVVARNDPAEQERVVVYDPAADSKARRPDRAARPGDGIA
jgi:uncharacterized RmlC-like cupin family protein